MKLLARKPDFWKIVPSGMKNLHDFFSKFREERDRQKTAHQRWLWHSNATTIAALFVRVIDDYH
jgi:hypothetical protein